MDDSSSAVKYTEIVSLDNFNDCSDVTEVKQELVTMNVTSLLVFSFTDWCAHISYVSCIASNVANRDIVLVRLSVCLSAHVQNNVRNGIFYF